MIDSLKTAFKRAVINCSEFFNSPYFQLRSVCYFSSPKREEKYKRTRENRNAHIKWEPERRIETRSCNCQKPKLRNTRFIQYS